MSSIRLSSAGMQILRIIKKVIISSAMVSVYFGSRTFRFRRYNCLLVLSVVFFFLFLFTSEVPPVLVYVLEAGFPITRYAQSSSKYRPTSNQESEYLLHLQSTVPWAKTQHWENKNITQGSTGGVRFPTCRRLIHGNSDAIEEANNFMQTHFPFTRNDLFYIWETRNCARFVQERGYILDATKTEQDFPLAFSLLFFKDLELTERLLRAVYRPHNVYCLHLDKKSPPSMWKAARGLVSCFDNVFLSSTAITVQWGTFSVLQPELVCMKDVWAKKNWKYFINLTGQEFPLKTNLQLVKILSALNGSNDVDATTSTHYDWRWYNSFQAPHGIIPIKGSLHIAASRAFVGYMLHSTQAQEFLHWIRFTDFPDETFFSSLNHNHHLNVPGSYLGPPDTDAVLKPYLSRYKNWGTLWRDGQGRLNFHWPCHGKRVRGICVFGVGDLPLLTSRKEMFANKFHLDFEPLALDCMEEWLWNMTMDEYSGRISFDTSFYRQLDVVRNHVS